MRSIPALAMALAVAPVALALAACSPAYGGPGAGGATASDVRATGDFHGLGIETAIEVEVTIGSTTRVELQGPATWLAKLTTKVDDDGILRIALPSNKASRIPKLKALVTTPEFRSLSINGVGAVTAKAIRTKTFDLAVSGVGTLDLAGAVDTLRVSVDGTAELRGKDLVAQTVALTINGTGEAAVHAAKKIDISISGAGDVTVHGKPATVRKSITGAGTIDFK